MLYNREMESKSLEEVIRQYITLAPMTGSGWYPVLCKVCGDRGHKGLRGGFRFDGETVAYHCFNCGPEMNTIYDPSESKGMPRKMQTVLSDFGVPKDEWQVVLFDNLATRKAHVKGELITKIENIEPNEIELPECFYMLSEAGEDDKWAEVARWYLKEERGINPNDYPFMIVKPSSDPFMKKWNGRLIIPMFKDNKLIFYQGRDLTNEKMKKYESPSVSKDKILYGFDKLLERTDMPLYVVEGWFDAFVIDGIAILGNEISKAHIQWLNRSPRKKVYVPDRFGDGHRSAEKALDLGWSISTPDVGQSVKDMSDAVHKYGKMYVMKSLVDNTADGFIARTNLGIYCEQNASKKKD